MFKKGDRVKVHVPGDQIDGLEGMVTRVEPDKLWPVMVCFNYFGLSEFNWPFEEYELEKLDD